MCRRAKEAFTSASAITLTCHAGLTNVAEPILVDNNPVAVIQYGAFVIADENETERADRLEHHTQAMRRLNADGATAEKIERLLLEKTPQRELNQWELSRQASLSLLSRIIYEYVSQKEKDYRLQQGAYHDLQLRLAAALAHAENLQETLPADSPIREAFEDILGAIEASVTVMHSLTRGQYLPQEYRFTRCYISELIDHAIVLARAEARKKEIDIDCALEPHNGRIALPISESHLQQALNNLIHNAVKYSYRTAPNSNRRLSAFEVAHRKGITQSSFPIMVSGLNPTSTI
jgi:signal transduction histidine kinase